jgi:regulator of sigma E protease
MSILKFVFIFLEVLMLFNLLIFVHELGHFLAARWRGLRIDRFAIWFGKPIWSRRIGGVEYALGSIPAGGYVSLPQMASMEVIEGKSESAGGPLPQISALDKIIVAFAGPLFSFLLALAFAMVVAEVGRPLGEAETTTVIGYVEKDGPADKAGILPGDRILEVDGRPVTKFGGMGESVTWRVVRSIGDQVKVKVEREGKVLELTATPTKDQTKFWQRPSLRQIKIGPAIACLVAEVMPNSPAVDAGLRHGDEVTAINGASVHHIAAISDYVEQHPGEKLTLSVVRQGTNLEVSLTPRRPMSPADDKPRMGVVWEPNGKTCLAYPGAWAQVTSSVNTMIETFSALFTRHSDIKAQHLGGAVKIMSVYYRLFSSEDGWRLALWFSVLMNVNLAILNLLPLPVLDGGHIVLAVLEGIRRRPISLRIINGLTTTFAVVIIGFMLYLAFYDVQDLGKEGRADVRFAPGTADTH